jgi:hypothetical protein
MSPQHRRRPSRKRPAAKKPNAPPDGQNWIWWTKEMYESVAFQELVRHRVARIVVDRVAYEHLRHSGRENGRLKITFNNFIAWGMSRSSVGDAVAIAQALGFIRLVKRGRASFGDLRYPSEYAVTWQTIGSDIPTNPWRRIWSKEVAKAKIAAAMRERDTEKANNAERHKPRRLRKRPQTQFTVAKKQKAGT